MAAEHEILERMFRENRVPEEVAQAFYHALSVHGDRPEVTGIDIGFREVDGTTQWEGEHAVRVHVRRKLPRKWLSRREMVPAYIDGVQTDVIEAEYVPQLDPVRIGLQATLRPGISIGHPRSTPGTLGLFVRDNLTGEPCILSCGHVLRGPGSIREGEPTWQPGSPDTSNPQDQPVARFVRYDDMSDSAIARLLGNRATDNTIHGTTDRVMGLRLPHMGESLKKSGRTTDVTWGRVDNTGGKFGVVYGFRLVPHDNSGAPICRGGDSGAIWYDPNSQQGVGLHCKGPPRPESPRQYAIACALSYVFERLKISL